MVIPIMEGYTYQREAWDGSWTPPALFSPSFLSGKAGSRRYYCYDEGELSLIPNLTSHDTWLG